MGRITTLLAILIALMMSGCEPLALFDTLGELADPPQWDLSQTLLQAEAAGDQFGYTADMSENYLIVGAWLADESASDKGAAHIYVKTTTGQWQFQQKLTSDSSADNGYFGNSVAITDDYAVVGSAYTIEIFERSGTDWEWKKSFTEASTAFGAKVDIDGIHIIAGDFLSNEARIYKRDTDEWVHLQTLTHVDGARFGISVAICGQYAVVGDIWYEGTEEDEGRAYVYQLSGGYFASPDILSPSSPSSSGKFGNAVAISDSQIIVAETGVPKIHFYGLNGNEWILEDEETISGVGSTDDFGKALAVSGKVAIIGAASTETNTGAAYIYQKYDSDWIYTGTPLFCPVNEEGDALGSSVAFHGTSVFVGAPADDNAVGVDAGAGYIFKRK